ncbi:MAG: hypothetical protein AB1420_07290 [Bacillota bacterium]
MNEQILKDLVKCKLKLADCLIEHLPEPVGDKAREFKRVIMAALIEMNEMDKDSQVKGKEQTNRTGLKSIAID